MLNMIDLIRPDLRSYAPYRSARDEAKAGKIWLNANESPFLHENDADLKINRYPDKQPLRLQKQIADLYKVKMDQIVLSRGSDEAIDLLIRLFCMAGQDSIMTCPPTYGMYAVSARLQGAGIIEVPLLKDKGFQLDLSSIRDQWRPGVKILFLCSPNNPTGNLLVREDILTLCRELMGKSIMVVDEAYLDFADVDSLSQYIDQYPNLVILRTLSKAYGLAGARFGILIGQSELVKWILTIIAPYPLPSPVIKIISQALAIDRVNTVRKQIQQMKAEKKRMVAALQALPCVQLVNPSDANFILVKMTGNAEKIMEECGKNGIILRSMFDKPGLEDCIRISVGLPDENTTLINLLQQVGRV